MNIYRTTGPLDKHEYALLFFFSSEAKITISDQEMFRLVVGLDGAKHLTINVLIY